MKPPLALVGLCLMSAACGSTSPTATTPVAATPTTRSIAVALSDTVAAGTTAQATAVATLSNGSTQSVATGFKSDVPTVATVSDGGLVTGVSNGRANIYVVSDGQQGLKAIRVISNFQGNWTGRYTITNCSQTGIFATINSCASIAGSTAPISTTFTQSGETVSGRVSLGTLNTDSISAPISGDNSISFVGRIAGDPSIDVNFTFVSTTVGQLTGSMIQTWRFISSTGQMVLNGSISTPLTKSGGPILDLGGPRSGLEESLKALMGR